MTTATTAFTTAMKQAVIAETSELKQDTTAPIFAVVVLDELVVVVWFDVMFEMWWKRCAFVVVGRRKQGTCEELNQGVNIDGTCSGLRLQNQKKSIVISTTSLPTSTAQELCDDDITRSFPPATCYAVFLPIRRFKQSSNSSELECGSRRPLMA